MYFYIGSIWDLDLRRLKKTHFFGNFLEMNKSSKKLGVITQFASEEVVVQIQVTQRYLDVSRAVVY